MKTYRCLVAVAAAAAVSLAGCSGPSYAPADSANHTGEDQGGGKASAPASAPAEVTENQPAESPQEEPGSKPAYQVARTARVSLTVSNIDEAAARLRELAASKGGTIASENLVAGENGGRGSSRIVVSVPAQALDATLDALGSIGAIDARVVSSEDVSTQVADVDARIKTLDASIARLRELSKKASVVKDLTELERELTNRIAERDSLVAQQRVLAGRVAQSPITVTLRTPDQPGEIERAGFLGGLAVGWDALVSGSRVLMTVVGAVLPFAGVLGLIATPLLIWRRRGRTAAAAAEVKPGKDVEADPEKRTETKDADKGVRRVPRAGDRQG